MVRAWQLPEHGDWREIGDPFPDDGSFEERMRRLGYHAAPEAEWQSPHGRLQLAVHARDPGADAAAAAPAMFMISIRTATQYWRVYVDTVPRLMDVLARWVPVIEPGGGVH